MGRAFRQARASEAAGNRFDITASQADIVQLAIRETAQRVFGHARIVPSGHGRPDFRANTERARPAMDAVRVNRRHFSHLGFYLPAQRAFRLRCWI